jgi:hypothetical protein
MPWLALVTTISTDSWGFELLKSPSLQCDVVVQSVCVRVCVPIVCVCV